MELEIITPDRKVFAGKVSMVQVPGSKGSFAILEFHAPIISTLDSGMIKITEGYTESIFETSGGVIEVKKNNVVILAESIQKIK